MTNDNSSQVSQDFARIYGEFGISRESILLDSIAVPVEFHNLIPFAAFWGTCRDDAEVSDLFDAAPLGVKEHLNDLGRKHYKALAGWLGGEESYSESPTTEYLAFSSFLTAIDVANLSSEDDGKK